MLDIGAKACEPTTCEEPDSKNALRSSNTYDTNEEVMFDGSVVGDLAELDEMSTEMTSVAAVADLRTRPEAQSCESLIRLKK